MHKINLRPYQEECIQSAFRAWDEQGHRRLLVTLPTGTGKTIVFAEVIRRRRAAGDRRPVLIVAHRRELLEQAAEKVAWLNPDAKIAIECAGQRAPRDTDIIIASIQTLGPSGCKRLAWLRPGLIICDEAHHAIAPTYRRVFERFGAMGGDALLLGCTATPHRLDKENLRQIFQVEAYRMGLLEAIEQGWLASITSYRVVTGTDLGAVHTRARDFVTSELAAAVNVQARTEQVIEKWESVAKGRRTLVFCVNVQHAQDVAEAFRRAGYTAETVDGGMRPADRQAVLDRFRAGETQIVANCELLGEGFDLPAVSSVVMMRPTQSEALLTQQIGRGTRLAEGKRDVILIDVVDNTDRHRLATVPALVGLPADVALEGKDLLEGVREEEERRRQREERAAEATAVRLQVQELFAASELPEELRSAGWMAWARFQRGYAIGCGRSEAGGNRTARLERLSSGVYVLALLEKGLPPHRSFLGSDLRQAVKAAEEAIIARWEECLPIVRADARWRRQPISDTQRGILSREGLPDGALQGLNKGQAASLITRHFADRFGELSAGVSSRVR